jgi:hypothetical protein
MFPGTLYATQVHNRIFPYLALQTPKILLHFLTKATSGAIKIKANLQYHIYRTTQIIDQMDLAEDGIYTIAKWECHRVRYTQKSLPSITPSLHYPLTNGEQCHHTTDISDKNEAWNSHEKERCSNSSCKHKRCKKCFDLDSNNWQIQHCDGADCRTATIWPKK